MVKKEEGCHHSPLTFSHDAGNQRHVRRRGIFHRSYTQRYICPITNHLLYLVVHSICSSALAELNCNRLVVSFWWWNDVGLKKGICPNLWAHVPNLFHKSRSYHKHESACNYGRGRCCWVCWLCWLGFGWFGCILRHLIPWI